MTADVAVVGGGPAGSITALGLVRLGYRVTLLHAEAGATQRLECLPSSVWPLLGSLGVRTGTSWFTPCRQTRIRWSLPREETRPDVDSLLVRRDRLDALLLAAAAEAGVRLISCRKLVRPVQNGAAWHLDGLQARFLVDAAGRRGILPGWRRRQRLSQPLVAITGQCSGPPTAPPETRVEGLPSGWCWAATEDDGTWEASVFLNPAACAGHDHATLHRTALAQSTLLASLRPLPLPVRVYDASAWLAEGLVTPYAIKVGDSALARDPLSSQGVLAALRSAPGAVATVHAILAGADAGTMGARYEAACHDSATHHAAAVRAHYAAGAWRGTSFWTERSEDWESAQSGNGNPLPIHRATSPHP